MKKTLFFALVIAVLLSISVFAADEADMLIQNAPEFIQGDVMLISDLEEPASQLKYAPDGTPLFGDVDYEKDNDSYFAYDSAGNYLSIYYIESDMIEIYIHD